MSLQDTPKLIVRDILPNTKEVKYLIELTKQGLPVLVRLESSRGSHGYYPLNASCPDDVRPAKIGKNLDVFGTHSKKVVTGG